MIIMLERKNNDNAIKNNSCSNVMQFWYYDTIHIHLDMNPDF